MNINFMRELKNFDGEPLMENKQEGKVLTLRTVCVAAVGGRYQDENLTPEQHIDRFMLAKKIHTSNGEGVELSTDDVVLIKKLLAKTNYLPIVVGQACQLLEGKEV